MANDNRYDTDRLKNKSTPASEAWRASEDVMRDESYYRPSGEETLPRRYIERYNQNQRFNESDRYSSAGTTDRIRTDLDREYNPDHQQRFNRANDYASNRDRDYGTYGNDPDTRLMDGYGQSGHTGKGPKGWQRSDESIREKVSECLERDSQVDASEIEVSVKDAIVTLSGKVDDRRSKRRAENMIENLPGVKDVRNELWVDQSFFQQAKEVLTGESTSSEESSNKTNRKTGRH